jgi:predicted nucleic acid-binding protein
VILVDSSIWIDHLRSPQPSLEALLAAGRVVCHPFVIGELACGHLRQRQKMLAQLGELDQLPVVSHDEALAFVEARALAGRGVGWADVHLLASALVARAQLWSRDKRLAAVAAELGLVFVETLH